MKEDINGRIVLIDSGYGNNTTFLLNLDLRKLNYLGGIAKNRKITINKEKNASMLTDEFAESLSQDAFTEVILNLDKPKKVWLTTKEVEINVFKEKRIIAIVGDADTFSEATDIDYFITNVSPDIVTP